MDRLHGNGQSSDAKAPASPKPPPVFPRLNIPMMEDDAGIRPVDFNWSTVSQSPAISFSTTESLVVGRRTILRVCVRNLGNVDVTDAIVEAHYDPWYLNAPPFLRLHSPQPIDLRIVPIIPARDSCIVEMDWIPRSQWVSATVRARVLDLYSMRHHPLRSASWYPSENPQAAQRVARLVARPR
jgi:hypothetical protein